MRHRMELAIPVGRNLTTIDGDKRVMMSHDKSTMDRRTHVRTNQELPIAMDNLDNAKGALAHAE